MIPITIYRWTLAYGPWARKVHTGTIEARSDAGALFKARQLLKKLRDDYPRSRALVLRAQVPNRRDGRYVGSCIIRGGEPVWHRGDQRRAS